MTVTGAEQIFADFEAAVEAEEIALAEAFRAAVAADDAEWRDENRPDDIDVWVRDMDAIIAPHEAMVARNTLTLAGHDVRAAEYAFDVATLRRPANGWA
jgi:hypothetical protein